MRCISAVAEVALGVTNQVAVEVVPVRFREPLPGKNIGDNFVQGADSLQQPFPAARAPPYAGIQFGFDSTNRVNKICVVPVGR